MPYIRPLPSLLANPLLRLLPTPNIFRNLIHYIRLLPSLSANPLLRLLPAPNIFRNSMPYIRPLPFLLVNLFNYLKLKKRRLATDIRILEVLKLAIGLLKEEFDL